MNKKRTVMTLADINREAMRRADARMTTRTRAPGGPVNWDDWRDMLMVELCDAIALSLNCDPGSGWRTNDDFAGIEGYAERMRIIKSHLQDDFIGTRKNRCSWYKDITAHHSGLTDLRGYGDWAKGIGWEVPDQFPSGNEIATATADLIVENAAPPRPVQRYVSQEETIRLALKNAGYNLLALPRQRKGLKCPLKQMARDALGQGGFSTSRDVVDKAWLRCFKEGGGLR